MSERYYTNDKNQSVYYAIHIEMEKYLAWYHFNDDLSRLVYASNAYCFRERTNQNKKDGSLDFPFINWRRTSDYGNAEAWEKWSFPAFFKGIYIEELGAKVKFDPVSLTFESTFWTNREDDLNYAFNRQMNDYRGLTKKPYELSIGTVKLPLDIEIDQQPPVYDPDYAENDWLEKNKIHSFTMNFNLKFFELVLEYPGGTYEDTDKHRTQGPWAMTDTVLFDFASSKFGLETTSYDEALTLTRAYFDTE